MNQTKWRAICGALMAGLLVACGAGAGEQKLPANVVAVMSTKTLDQSFSDVDALVAESIKNTPFMMMVPAGAVKMGLFTGGLNLPEEMMAGGRGAHLVVSVDPANAEHVAASLALPVDNFAEKVKLLEQAGGVAQSVEAGVYKVTANGPKGSRTFYLLDAGKGWAVYDEDLATGKLTRQVLADWSPAEATATVSGVFDVAKLVNLHKEKIVMIPELIVADMKSKSVGKPEAEAVEALAPMVNGYGKLLVDFLQGVERIELNAQAGAAGLEVKSRCVAVAGTPFAKFVDALAAQTANSGELGKAIKLMPADCFSVATMNSGTAVNDFVAQQLVEIKSVLQKLKLKDEKAQAQLPNVIKVVDQFGAFFDAYRKAGASSSVTAYGIDANGTILQVVIAPLKAGAGEQLQKAITDYAAELVTIINELMANIGEADKKVPMTFSNASKTIGGVPVLVFDMKMELPDEVKDNPGAALMLEKMTQSYHYCLGTKNDQFILTMGTKAEEEFAALLKRMDGGASVFPAAYLKGYEQVAEKNLFYSAFYLDAMCKQLYLMLGPVFDQQPEVKMVVAEFCKGIEASGSGITITTGTKAGEITHSLTIPLASYKGLIDQGVKAFMMAQMQQQMKMQKGGAAPMKLDGGSDEKDAGDEEEEKDGGKGAKGGKTLKNVADEQEK